MNTNPTAPPPTAPPAAAEPAAGAASGDGASPTLDARTEAAALLWDAHGLASAAARAAEDGGADPASDVVRSLSGAARAAALANERALDALDGPPGAHAAAAREAGAIAADVARALEALAPRVQPGASALASTARRLAARAAVLLAS
jgi:hypothetical protein